MVIIIHIGITVMVLTIPRTVRLFIRESMVTCTITERVTTMMDSTAKVNSTAMVDFITMINPTTMVVFMAVKFLITMDIFVAMVEDIDYLHDTTSVSTIYRSGILLQMGLLTAIRAVCIVHQLQV